MIPVAHPIRKPRNFTRDCETPGKAWERANPTSDKFPALWQKYQPQLATGFHDRCGWWAMRIADGAVDHYLSKKFHRDRAYDWNNYRYISPTVNSTKQNRDDKVLDPFDIQPGWFEVHLPSMLLKCTTSVPPEFQTKADFTVDKLLNSGKARRNRRGWYIDYKNGLPMPFLEQNAPLVAAAVTEWIRTKGLPLP
jgi:hypothetical protein